MLKLASDAKKKWRECALSPVDTRNVKKRKEKERKKEGFLITMPPKASFIGSRLSQNILKALGVAGAIACGLFSTYKLMWQPESVRWAIVFFYVSFFSLFIISAELGLLNHKQFRKFGMFLTTYSGRAAFYIFLGGLLLHDYGWIPGVYMLCLGVTNVVAQCVCTGDAAARPNSTAVVAAQTPAAI